MTDKTDAEQLLEDLYCEAGFFGNQDDEPNQLIGARLQATAETMQKFLDTLKRIARNQGRIPSHEAQDVLSAHGVDWNQ